jgi:hypothetical protein
VLKLPDTFPNKSDTFQSFASGRAAGPNTENATRTGVGPVSGLPVQASERRSSPFWHAPDP